MNYVKDILSKLIDKYEKREAYDKEVSSLRVIQIEVVKEYPSYMDRYNHEAYIDINTAIQKLVDEECVDATSDDLGRYTKIKLNLHNIDYCYKKLNRVNIPEQCNSIKEVLNKFEGSNFPILRQIVTNFKNKMDKYQKLPYQLRYDKKRTLEVLTILQAILKLDTETYIRNFSTALFRDSKRFQKEFRATIESILFDYTDKVVEKDRILEFYNLYENPTYVLIKGDVQIAFNKSIINVVEMQDGIALSNASLDKITRTKVNAKKVVTVENLTTYHDLYDKDAVYIYLGGYHNSAKQKLLEKIYEDNRECGFYHAGDIDVYGFLILENLKTKTNIPFKPFMMDIETLKRFYEEGLYRELNANDVKVIRDNKETKLVLYKDVLDFMLENNCKVEQESIKALELME